MSTEARFAALMDDAARRVLASNESAYDVSIHALSDSMHMAFEYEHAMGGYIHWAEISDLADAPRGPMSLEACAEAAAEFSRRWLATPERATEPAQRQFFVEWKVRWEQIAERAYGSNQ